MSVELLTNGRFLRLFCDPEAVRITETTVGMVLISIMAVMAVYNTYAQVLPLWMLRSFYVADTLIPRTCYCSPALISIALSVDQSFLPLAPY